MFRMRAFLYILLLFSCSIFKSNNTNQAIKESTDYIVHSEELPLLTMRRTPCYGKCPTYKIKIFPNGKVLYEGVRFVEKIGLYKSVIDLKKIALIEEKIRYVDFFNFQKMYDARVTDLPSTIIEVNLKGKSYKVTGRYKMPLEFKSLSKFIDDVIFGIEKWNKIID